MLPKLEIMLCDIGYSKFCFSKSVVVSFGIRLSVCNMIGIVAFDMWRKITQVQNLFMLEEFRRTIYF